MSLPSKDLPSLIAVWLPRSDEFALARSLGLVEREEEEMRLIITELNAEYKPQGVIVRVGRWHIWRVVRTMHRLGVLSTPDGRAYAYGILATEKEA